MFLHSPETPGWACKSEMQISTTSQPQGLLMHHQDTPLCTGKYRAEGDVQGSPSDGETHPLKQALISSRIYNSLQDLLAMQQQMTSHTSRLIHTSKSAKEKPKNKFMTRLPSVLLKSPLKIAFEGFDTIWRSQNIMGFFKLKSKGWWWSRNWEVHLFSQCHPIRQCITHSRNTPSTLTTPLCHSLLLFIYPILINGLLSTTK